MGYRRASGKANRRLRKPCAVRAPQSHTVLTQWKPHGSFTMDKNRTEGTKREFKGTVKEVTGKVTGNKSKEVAGNIEKNTGKVQKQVGQTADQLRDAAHKRGDDIDHRP